MYFPWIGHIGWLCVFLHQNCEILFLIILFRPPESRLLEHVGGCIVFLLAIYVPRYTNGLCEVRAERYIRCGTRLAYVV
jgi:hypothetical protein